MDKDQIVSDIYSTYGSDSGVLFGIKEKEVVKAIVEFTLNRCNPEPSLTLQQGLDIWDACDNEHSERSGHCLPDSVKATYFASIGYDINKTTP